MKNNKRWQREMKRYRIIQHELRGESFFVIEWNDKWFLGIWGRWHPKFQTLKIEEAISKIQRLVALKLNR
jgi:RNase P/RNase MRP subunit p29